MTILRRRPTAVKARKPNAAHPSWLPGDNPDHVPLIGSSADLRRRRQLSFMTIARFTILISIAPCQARAADAIKFGNWVYSMTVPEVTQLPRGVYMSPDMTFQDTKCVTAADPVGFATYRACKLDKIDLNGGTLRWSVICTKPPATTTLEWIEHYHGKTMDGQINQRTIGPDYLYERKQTLQGRYLGPCTAK